MISNYNYNNKHNDNAAPASATNVTTNTNDLNYNSNGARRSRLHRGERLNPHCSCGTVLRRFAAGMRPPFSPRGDCARRRVSEGNRPERAALSPEINGPRPVQKTRQEGDFDFPLLHLPLDRHKGAGCGPPLWIPLPEGCKPINCAPHERLAKRKARRCRISASVARYRPMICCVAKQ